MNTQPDHVANDSSPTYRPMTSADVAVAQRMSFALSWPHREEDWQAALQVGTGFVAEHDGAVIGTAVCWKFGVEHASLGLVIVADAYQGRGIGRKLMELLLAEAGPRATFLHATPAGKPLYEKLGFGVCGLLHQHQGRVTTPSPVTLPDTVMLREALPADEPALLALALKATGLERDAMLKALFSTSRTVVLERDGVITGFSVFRRFGRGYVIGPVIAEPANDDLHAKALVGYWLTGRENEYVRIDVPDGSSLNEWLAPQGMPCVDSVVKMVRNAPPDAFRGPPDSEVRWYALISQSMF